MNIKNMFEKDISRNIKGVIKVGQTDEENIYQELDEYVVTNELAKHFKVFFDNYSTCISKPTDDIGVWISGFFGSGKSHFLKILSYILDSNLIVKGRRPIDFFKEDGKIKDAMVIGDMERATNVKTDVVLFNIDTKSSQNSDKNILSVFIKVFNEMRGYSGGMPFLADFEKNLDEVGKFVEFKNQFRVNTGNNWEDWRNKFYYIQDEIIKTITDIDFMSEDAAKNWVENAESNIDLSIENFTNEVKDYCNKTKHNVVFLVDEVGQFIADDTPLMLDLQTIVEELGIKCHGKAWVIVTSQQNIDDITRNIRGMDFSKIQGRFKTKLSLSSSNVDEVIRRRILAKNENAQDFLELKYPEIEHSLKNIINFDNNIEMKTYENATDFANIYPFVTYQFYRVQDVLTSIRHHSASGVDIADSERSMLALFQESAIAVQDCADGTLVPFNIFYQAIDKDQFIDHIHKIVITRAKDNDELEEFDVEILKVLFMVKYVKEIKATVENITTLMISNINEDRLELKNNVEKSLKRLLDQTFIQKNGTIYSFLTNEEQDMNNKIKHEQVDNGEILDEAYNKIFGEIYGKTKFKVDNRYNFSFNKSIDDREKSSKHDMGIRIITPYYESNKIDYGQTSLDDDGDNLYNILKGLSEENNEVVIYFPNDLTVFDEIKESLQISKYLTKNGDLKNELKFRKQEEYNDKIKRIKIFLEDSIKSAVIYVKGDKVDIPEKNAESRLDEAMDNLVNKVYNKLYYMDFAPEKNDILKILDNDNQSTFNTDDIKCFNALNDVEEYISNQFAIHSNPSLKNIIDRFSKAPYGFKSLDVQWLIANLFAQKKISIKLNSKEISIKNEGKEKVLNYITKKEFSEKLLISKKEKTNEHDIKLVNELLREVYNENTNSNDDEKLMDIFKKANFEKLNEIKEYLIEYKSPIKFPGNDILTDAKDLFNEINSKNSTSEFYKFINLHEDDFLDILDDLEPVISFFKSKQKGIYVNSYNIHENYKSNKNLLQSSQLDEIALDIKRILDMPNPYSYIKDLPELNNKFEEKFSEILDSKREIVHNDINDNRKSVLEYLNTDELKNKFEEQIKLEFDKLIGKLNNEQNIAIINGITTESDILKTKYVNKIQKVIQTPGSGGEPTPMPVKESNVYIKEIVSASRVKIKTEDDLDYLFIQIKDKVKDELNKNDIVNLKF